jgi:MoaA/NifB/PqqE/SkfB family radical SAM enzyme
MSSIGGIEENGDVSDSPLIVVWRVTGACRLSCGFCGYSRAIARRRAVADADEVRRLGKVLGDYSRRAGRKVLVSWLGGEPLEWPPLAELAPLFRDEFGLLQGVTTSGAPLRLPSVRRMLCQSHDQVTVSIDGLAGFHDRVRGCPGLFEAVRGYVARLRDECQGRLLLRANTILMRGNIDSFPALCEELAAWGFHELTFNQLGGNERPEFFPANCLLPEQVDRFRNELPAVRRSMAPRGLEIRGSERYLERIASTTRGQKVPIADCVPGARFLFIDEQGRISPCSFTSEEYGIPLAQILSTESLRALPQCFRESRRSRRLATCTDCHATHVFDKFC